MTDQKKKFVDFRGQRVIEGWPEALAAAQEETSVLINGKEYSRIRYGDEHEDWNAAEVPCHDCLAVKGEYHVWECDVEECPACGGQMISCDCGGDDDEFDDED